MDESRLLKLIEAVGEDPAPVLPTFRDDWKAMSKSAQTKTIGWLLSQIEEDEADDPGAVMVLMAASGHARGLKKRWLRVRREQ